jgi:hypothetical protein
MHGRAIHGLAQLREDAHKTLKMTPAVAAGVSRKLCSVGDIVDLIEATEAPAPDMGDMLVG